MTQCICVVAYIMPFSLHLSGRNECKEAARPTGLLHTLLSIPSVPVYGIYHLAGPDFASCTGRLSLELSLP